jgi:hypothetical protein
LLLHDDERICCLSLAIALENSRFKPPMFRKRNLV